MNSHDNEVMSRLPVTEDHTHGHTNGVLSENSMLRRFSNAVAATAGIEGSDRRTSTTKGPERKISATRGPERKISGAVDPMYIHLSEDVDESEEEDDDDDYDINDLDDDYTEEGGNQPGWNCCDETRDNWIRFGRQMTKQGRELKESAKRIDAKKYLRQCCSLDTLKKILPIIQWAPKYNLTDLQGDLIAGTTVGLTVIPQSIAYAFIAGLPPQYGLYSAFIGSFVYVLFGSSKDITLGPSAVASLLTALYGVSPIPNDASFAIVLCFLCGFVYLGMAILRLGFFMDFVSYPVIKAFTSAAAITIAMSQIKKWFGQTGVPSDFFPQLYWTVAKIPQTRIWDFVLGVCCISLIVFLRKLKEYKWDTSYEDLPVGWKIVNKTIWILGTGRNILAIVLASVVAYIFLQHGLRPFSLIGYIVPGIPPFQLPAFTVIDKAKNVTYNLAYISNSINVGYIIVPVIGLIEAMAIGNVFARKFDYRIDPNQELLAYGIGNVLTGLFSGFPITGTFSRTAVNAQSGVRTPAGGIVTGAIVLISLQFLTPLFYYIPQCSLAVVIVLAVVDMITFHKLWIFWRIKKIDLIPWIVTFILSFVLNMAYGVLIGIGLSLLLLLYPATRPKIKVIKPQVDILLSASSNDSSKADHTVIVVKFYSGLMYPAIEYMKDVIIPLYSKTPLPKGVIFDFHHVAVIDSTTVQGLRILLESFQKKGITVVFCQLQKSVDEILTRAKPRHFKKTGTPDEATRLILELDSPSVKPPLKLSEKRQRRIHNNNSLEQQEALGSRLRLQIGEHNPAFQQ